MESEALDIQVIMPKFVESCSVIQLTCEYLCEKQKQDFRNTCYFRETSSECKLSAAFDNKNHQAT